MIQKIFILFLLFLLIGKFSNAQHTFNAIVKDSISGETLVGAIVSEQGTTNGAATDLNGQVKLKLPEAGDFVFTIQYLGYTQKNIKIQIPQPDSVIFVLLSNSGTSLDEVTISSVRTNSRIEDVPTRIEVLGVEDLNEENGVKPGNLMSLLGDIAGIQMQQVSATSGNTYARIQGLNGRYTQLLKDGIPQFGGLSGSFGIMQIPPLDLKQIEIIKGSASTLYGGDAIGGIINLISKEPGEVPELSFTVNQSSLLETNLNAYYAKRFHKIGITLFAAHTIQKEGDINDDGLSDVPNVNSTVIHPKFIFYCNPKSTVTLNYSGTFDKRKGGDIRYFTSNSSDTLFHINNVSQRNTADVKWLYQFSKANSFTAKFSSSNFAQDLGTKFYSFKANQLFYYSELSYVHIANKVDWVGGLNFNGDIFNNKSISLPELTDYNYKTVGAFIQNTWKPFEKVIVESGFRADDHSVFGLFLLPRLSILYKFNNQLSARVNGGFGYKTPNVITYLDPETELSYFNSTASLNSELSQGLNCDFNFSKLFTNELSFTMNQAFFYTDISKPIYDSSSSTTRISLVNADKGLLTMGLQSYIRIKYKLVELYLGYVFTNVEKTYDTIHPELIVTPKHNLASTFFYEPSEKFRVGFESSFIAGQLDENYSKVKDYVLFAAMVQYNAGKITFVLNGENVLDFRQNKNELLYSGSINNPLFHKLWAPIDGRVINLSVKVKI